MYVEGNLDWDHIDDWPGIPRLKQYESYVLSHPDFINANASAWRM